MLFRSADALKRLCYDIKIHFSSPTGGGREGADYVAVLCANIGGKPAVAIGIADSVVAAKGLDAGKIVKEIIAPIIKGGGGGQKNLATAGGQEAGNLQLVIEKVKSIL